MAKNIHAIALGKLGGSVKSARKTEAVRLNAQKPRPNRKKKPRELSLESST